MPTTGRHELAIASLLLMFGFGAEGVYPQSAKLTAADAEVFDSFGSAVAVSGDTAVIGAHFDDDLGTDSGSAYIFERDPSDPTAWTQTAKLTASDGAPFDEFGRSVSISDDTIIIGASFDDDLGDDSGAAYVFERDAVDPTVWSEAAKLTASDGAALDEFGDRVAVFGDTALVGAHLDDDLGVNSGSVYVFERDPIDSTVWIEVDKLTASDGSASDDFGNSVSLTEATLIVAAHFDGDLGLFSGSAYIFERDPSQPTLWNETAKLTASDGGFADFFGRSVALAGHTALVGSPGDDDLGDASGAAYVFERDPGDPAGWTEIAKLTASDGATSDNFGSAVALTENRAVVGAWAHDEASGAAYVFERDPVAPTEWTETRELRAADGAPGDTLGRSPTMVGDTVLVGADQDDGSGAVYAFEQSPLLVVPGSCPGAAQVKVHGATPDGTVWLIRGTEPGSFVLGGGCSGTEIGLETPQLQRILTANDAGNIEITTELPGAACGLYLQALDRSTCETTAVVQVPR